MSDTRRAEAERQGQSLPGQPISNESAEPGAIPAGRVVAVDAGGSGWISLIVGMLVILFWPRLWQWLSHKLFGTAFTWTFTDTDGSSLSYEQSWFFWGDLAIGLFGISLLIEGAVLLLAPRSRLAIWIALVFVASATALNIGYLIYMVIHGQGLQLPSVMAALFGGFMTVQHWQLLHGPRRRYLIIEE